MTIANIASVSRGARRCSLPSSTRGLRTGIWISHVERYRTSRYRYSYMEAQVTRKLSWDNSSSRDGDGRDALKKAMDSMMPTAGKTRPRRCTDADKVKSWSDDLSELRPGRTMEEIESEAVDHALSRKGPVTTKKAYKDVSPDKVLKATTGASFTPKYEDVDNYANPSHRNRQFTSKDAAVAAAAAAAATAEAAKYGAVRWNEPDGLPQQTPEEKSKQYSDLDKYKPVSWNEPDGLPSKTPEEQSKEYDDLDKYGAIRWNEPDGLPLKTAEEKSKEYDDLDKYGPVHWNEPDGLQLKTDEELSKNYDDLHKYSSGVRWHEPDGLPDPTPEELSKNYKDLDQYANGVAWHEPDGLRVLTPEEKSKQYDDLQTYADPFDNPDKAIEAQHAREMDTTQKGSPLPPAPEVNAEPPVYEDSHKYGPVRWNEPDGLRKLTPEELSKNYDDLHLYGAVRWNEPDGLRKLTPEEKSKQYKDLKGYGGNVSPAINRVHPEVASKAYADLGAYGDYENGDEIQRIHPEEASKRYQDLGSYKPTHFDPIDTAYPMHPEEATKAYRDLGSYKPIWYNEAGNQPQALPTGLDAYDTTEQIRAASARGINRRGPQGDMEPLTADAIRARTLRNAAQRSQQQQAVSQQTLTGNYARDFPEDFSQKWTQSHNSSALIPDHMVSEDGQQPVDKEDVDEVSSMDESFPMLENKLQPALDRAGAPALSRVDTRAQALPKQFEDLKPPREEEDDTKFVSEPLIVRHYAAKPSPKTPSHVCPVSKKPINPIDMMGRSAISSSASPTGFVNYETATVEDKPIPPHRQPFNDAYAYDGYDEPHDRKRRGTAKKIAIGVYWATPAALCAWLWMSNSYREKVGQKEQKKAGLMEVVKGR